MNTYRTFEADGEMNARWAKEKGKCGVRCLALWGAQSFADEATASSMCQEYYGDFSFDKVEGAGHWIAEERPQEFVEKIVKWVGRS